MSSWTDRSAEWLQEQVKAHPEMSKDELCKWCSKNYPFAERRGWAYKAWLKALRVYFNPQAVRPKQHGVLQTSPAELGSMDDRITEVARAISIEVAKNCGSVPQLTFPHIYLGLKEFVDAGIPASVPETRIPVSGALPELPPLPEHGVPNLHLPREMSYRHGWFTDSQTEAYARQFGEMVRAADIALVDGLRHQVSNGVLAVGEINGFEKFREAIRAALAKEAK